MQKGKLNLLHTISTSSGSRASVFNISGVISEGIKEVVSWRRFPLVMYCSSERGSNLLGRKPVTETIFGGNYLCLILVWVFSMPFLDFFDLHNLSCLCTLYFV